MKPVLLFDKLIQFQFTPLREGRPPASFKAARIWLFQFTPLREGRPTCPMTTTKSPIFQFTPLREGRRYQHPEISAKQRNFNSRPSARGDG